MRATMHLILAATAMMAASTLASAQSMKAQIPFAFNAGRTTLPAGTYWVARNSGAAFFYLSETHGKGSVLLVPNNQGDPSRALREAGDPTLQFACGEGSCSLKQIWTGGSQPAYQFPTPALGKKPADLSLIRLVPTAVK